jgi:exosome complex component RRP41
MSLDEYEAGMIISKKRDLIVNGKRLDGRELDELRPMTMKVGVLPQADGSAFVTHGNNKILVAIYGPRELHPRHLIQINKARIRVEYRLATFSVQERKSPAPRRREHELSKVIQEAVEPSVFTERFPRSGIDIYVQVLDADGGTRAASITAASLALADAGIPLKGLVASVAAGKAGGKVILDLFDVEDKEGEADLPIAILSQNQEITLCQMDGHMTREEVAEALELAKKGCEKIHQMQREALMERYKEISSQTGENYDGEGEEIQGTDLDSDLDDKTVTEKENDTDQLSNNFEEESE